LSKYTVLFVIFAVFIAGSAIAQTSTSPDDGNASSQTPQILKETYGKYVVCRERKLQFYRPTNECGINMFETPETDPLPFEKFTVDWGAGFVQGFQDLKHSNNAEPPIELAHMGPGANRAGANLYLNAQLADGIRLQLTSYLSSRHHEETWVKDGYVQMDKSPINLGPFNALWDRFLTVKVGHMEINYGDAHFRRTDNGNGMYNPFVGNLMLDSFATEIGAEAYAHANGVMLMGGITGGEIKGNVLTPEQRSPAFHWKAAFDRQVKPDLRVRLSISSYIDRKSPANTLFRGDRAGSVYYFALENTAANDVDQAFSGRINPGLRNKVTAYQFNQFVKFHGLELFGVIEHAAGLNFGETVNRTWNQYDIDAVYRFFQDKMYAGIRYDYVEGQLPGMADRVDHNRLQVAGGWFILPYLLLKAEFVNQNYNNYPVDSIYHEANFHGLIGHAVLGF
jgi:hypothetical protein